MHELELPQECALHKYCTSATFVVWHMTNWPAGQISADVVSCHMLNESAKPNKPRTQGSQIGYSSVPFVIVSRTPLVCFCRERAESLIIVAGK